MRSFVCLLFWGLLAGCSTLDQTPAQDLAGARAQLQAGRSTRAEAERLLGAGSSLRFDSGWSTLHYVYRPGGPRLPASGVEAGQAAPAGGSGEAELLLLFDPDGVLRTLKWRV